MDKRAKIADILEKTADKDFESVFVESVRAICDQPSWYQKVKKANIQIVPADIPDLCVLNPNPVQMFIRPVIGSGFEMDNRRRKERPKQQWPKQRQATRS